VGLTSQIYSILFVAALPNRHIRDDTFTIDSCSHVLTSKFDVTKEKKDRISNDVKQSVISSLEAKNKTA